MDYTKTGLITSLAHKSHDLYLLVWQFYFSAALDALHSQKRAPKQTQSKNCCTDITQGCKYYV